MLRSKALRRFILGIILFPAIVPLHAQVVFDLPHREGGWECHRVEADGSETALIPDGRKTAQFNDELKAAAYCQAQKILVPGDYRLRMTGFIEIVISSDAAAQVYFRAPGSTTPSPQTPPAGWSQVSITGGTYTYDMDLSYDSGAFNLVSNDGGVWFYTADDGKVWSYDVNLSSDFTGIACLSANGPNATAAYPLGGIEFRESNGANSARISALAVGIDGGFGYEASVRASTGASVTLPFQDSTPLNLSDGGDDFKIEYDAALGSIKLFHATSCSSPSWGTAFYSATVGWSGTGKFNLIGIVSDDAEAAPTGTVTINGVTTDDTTSVDHSGGGSFVEFCDPSGGPYNEDVTPDPEIAVCRTGTLSGALQISADNASGDTCNDGQHDDPTDTVTFADGSSVASNTITLPVNNQAGQQPNCNGLLDLVIDSGSDSIGANSQFSFSVVDTDTGGGGSNLAWTQQGVPSCGTDAYGDVPVLVPGMRGPGSCTRAGFVPGTTVYVISNTNTSGTGSLAAFANATCPKVGLVGVAGLVNQGGSIIFRDCDNWSLVGASAPGNFTVTGASDRPQFITNGSDWSIDHITIAAGDLTINPSGSLGNRDSISIGNGTGPKDHGVVFNNTIIWGADETVQCYQQQASKQSYILYWQNIIGVQMGASSGAHIIQNTCPYNGSIRNYYIDSQGRAPLVRANGYFHANNYVANFNYEAHRFQPCDGGTYPPVDSTITEADIGNVVVQGAQTTTNLRPMWISDSTTCATIQLHETGNQFMRNDFTLFNCANHGCVLGSPDSYVTQAGLGSIYPTGYVPETIDATQQAVIDFATLITTYAGAHPTNRLTYVQGLVDDGIDMVDGTGYQGSFYQRTTVVAEGGISQITPSSASIDPTSAAENPCGEDMPTGAAADAITTSNRTRLQEWVGGCFYDHVMPSGWRPQTLSPYSSDGYQYYVSPP